MAARKGRTIKAVFDELKAQNERVSQWAAIREAALSGTVAADLLANGIYHDCRREVELINLLQTVVDTLGASPALGRQALRDYAEAQYGATYDILAETVALRNLLQAAQSEVVALMPVNAGGYIIGDYIKLSDTPPFFVEFAPAQTAATLAAVQAIGAHIVD